MNNQSCTSRMMRTQITGSLSLKTSYLPLALLSWTVPENPKCSWIQKTTINLQAKVNRTLHQTMAWALPSKTSSSCHLTSHQMSFLTSLSKDKIPFSERSYLSPTKTLMERVVEESACLLRRERIRVQMDLNTFLNRTFIRNQMKISMSLINQRIATTAVFNFAVLPHGSQGGSIWRSHRFSFSTKTQRLENSASSSCTLKKIHLC